MDWDLGRIIAMNLKQLRTERSLTLGQLAKESGVSKAILSDMEKGESNPTIIRMLSVSEERNKMLGLYPADLYSCMKKASP